MQYICSTAAYEAYTGYMLAMQHTCSTAAYAASITAAAPGRVCLDIGTGSLALLALIAARAGAKHVYAIEANPEAAAYDAEAAGEQAPRRKLGDQIKKFC